MKYKKFIIGWRIGAGIVALMLISTCLVFLFLYLSDKNDNIFWAFFLLSCILFLLISPFLLLSLILKYKEYNYNDKKIAVYAGWFKSILLIDDVICDVSSTPYQQYMCADVDGQLLEIKVTSFNKIFVWVGNTPLNA